MYADTATRQRAAEETDRYGNTVGAWDTPDELVFACIIQPADTSETLVDRDTVVTRWSLHCASSVDITPLDRVVWKDRTLAVDGDLELHCRKGVPHHLEAFLRGTSG